MEERSNRGFEKKFLRRALYSVNKPANFAASVSNFRHVRLWKIQRVERQPSPIILFHAPLFFSFLFSFPPSPLLFSFLRIGARGNLRYFFERRESGGKRG